MSHLIQNAFFVSLILCSLLYDVVVGQEIPLPQPGRKGDYTLKMEGVLIKTYANCLARYTYSKPEDIQKLLPNLENIMQENPGVIPSWEVHVPDAYDEKEPWGLMVFINSGESGKIKGDWKAIHAKHKMIWIGANGSGNKHNSGWRHALAVEAVRLMGALYNIDVSRIYVSGNSGGGRISSQVMIAHANIFSGGFPHVGVNPYRAIPLGNNTEMRPSIRMISKELLEHARVNSRFVLLTGDKDFNREQTKQVYDAYKEDGFKVTYLQVPNMGHSSPPADWYEKGIVALDAPLKAAAASYEEAKAAQKAKKFDVALEKYKDAANNGGYQEFTDDARAQFAAIKENFAKDLAEIEKLIEEKNKRDAIRKISTFRKTWGDKGVEESKRLIEKLK